MFKDELMTEMKLAFRASLRLYFAPLRAVGREVRRWIRWVRKGRSIAVKTAGDSGWGADSNAAVRMPAAALANANAFRIELRCPEQLWICIRRLDRREDPAFARFDGQPFGLKQIEALLPNWYGLEWTQIEGAGDLSRGEWYACEGAYRINLYGDPNSSLEHRQVMNLWLGFVARGNQTP